MKKMLSLVLALLMLLALPAFAEDEEITLVPVEGIVTETADTYFMLESAALGELQVNITEETYFSEEVPFAAGQYAFVTFDGKMTRSLPAQITAISVNVSRFAGTVFVIDEEANILLVDSELHGDVVVYLPATDSAANYNAGDLLMIYNNGAMTMSLPPQVNASMIVRLETLIGVITEITEDYAVITDTNGTYQVNFAPDTTVTINSVEMKVGDVMTVLYNGMMTRSLPPQVSAIEITVDSVSVIE